MIYSNRKITIKSQLASYYFIPLLTYLSFSYDYCSVLFYNYIYSYIATLASMLYKYLYLIYITVTYYTGIIHVIHSIHLQFFDC